MESLVYPAPEVPAPLHGAGLAEASVHVEYSQRSPLRPGSQALSLHSAHDRSRA